MRERETSPKGMFLVSQFITIAILSDRVCESSHHHPLLLFMKVSFDPIFNSKTILEKERLKPTSQLEVYLSSWLKEERQESIEGNRFLYSFSAIKEWSCCGYTVRTMRILYFYQSYYSERRRFRMDQKHQTNRQSWDHSKEKNREQIILMNEDWERSKERGNLPQDFAKRIKNTMSSSRDKRCGIKHLFLFSSVNFSGWSVILVIEWSSNYASMYMLEINIKDRTQEISSILAIDILIEFSSFSWAMLCFVVPLNHIQILIYINFFNSIHTSCIPVSSFQMRLWIPFQIQEIKTVMIRFHRLEKFIEHVSLNDFWRRQRSLPVTDRVKSDYVLTDRLYFFLGVITDQYYSFVQNSMEILDNVVKGQ